MIPLPFALPTRWKRPLVRALIVAAGILGYIIAAGAAGDAKASAPRNHR